MQLEIDKEDITMLGEKETNKSLGFRFVKYSVAALPILIPFIGLMYFTNDVLVSILGTALIDFFIIVIFISYILNSSNVKIPWK